MAQTSAPCRMTRVSSRAYEITFPGLSVYGTIRLVRSQWFNAVRESDSNDLVMDDGPWATRTDALKAIRKAVEQL